MNKKHISKFPVGTLVKYKRGHDPKPTITYGIVIGHTKLNVKVLLAETFLGSSTVVTSPQRLDSVQRLHQKPKVQRP